MYDPKKIICLLAALPCLSGCGLYATYERHATPADSSEAVRADLRADSVPADGRGSVPALHEFFTDTLLLQLVDEGLAHGSEPAVAELHIREARGELRAARAALLPTASLAADGALRSYDGASADKSYSLGIDASWEPDFRGTKRNEKRKQAAVVEENEAEAEAVRVRLVATIACNYYLLLTCDAQIEVTERTVATRREYVAALSALVEAGRADRADLRQAEADRLAAEVKGIQLREEQMRLEHTLCALVGRMPGRILRSQPDGLAATPEWTAGSIDVAMLAHRPDVRAAEARMKQAHYAVGISRAAFYPSLSLTGSLGWTNSGGGAVTNPGALLWQAAASLVQPVFQQRRNRTNLEKARLHSEETRILWQQSVLDAAAEVNDALAGITAARERIGLLRQEITQLELALQHSEAKLATASYDYARVLLARHALLAAELELPDACYAHWESLIHLYSALGGSR